MPGPAFPPEPDPEGPPEPAADLLEGGAVPPPVGWQPLHRVICCPSEPPGPTRRQPEVFADGHREGAHEPPGFEALHVELQRRTTGAAISAAHGAIPLDRRSMEMRVRTTVKHGARSHSWLRIANGAHDGTSIARTAESRVRETDRPASTPRVDPREFESSESGWNRNGHEESRRNRHPHGGPSYRPLAWTGTPLGVGTRKQLPLLLYNVKSFHCPSCSRKVSWRSGGLVAVGIGAG